MPVSDYETLSDKYKEEFAHVINTLLFQNYVVERLYNPGKAKFEMSSDYRFIDYNRDLVRDYLRMMGWELVEDTMNSVYSVKNITFSNSRNLTRVETLFLLVLRLIYEEKQSKASLSRDVDVKLSEILNKFEVFKLFEKNPTDSEIKPALKLLKKYQIIEKRHGTYTDIDTIFIIYPSIVHALSGENLVEIIKKYDPSYRKKSREDAGFVGETDDEPQHEVEEEVDDEELENEDN